MHEIEAMSIGTCYLVTQAILNGDDGYLKKIDELCVAGYN
jgi:hypothetical protein